RITPRYTLFLYTTLFRSWGKCLIELNEIIKGTKVKYRNKFKYLNQRLEKYQLLNAAARNYEIKVVYIAPERPRGTEKTNQLYIKDRKSTRLNSSHLVISY